ncbi:flagellar protein FlgN [Syntrophomonas palmitatica]|uniref:flagellar protein FlgN n=1 Tax=Syntrophomonas palmitatica TaxID=402877 RepID=UPI0012ED8DDC|nr:flagellar protein FlgN [Syntrophomonas palmitatica]
MENRLKTFIEMLNRENDLLDSLVEIGDKKRQLIILGEVKELDKLIQKEGIVLSNLDKQEGARFKLQQELSVAWGMKPEELVATELLKRLSGKHEDLYKPMQEAIERLDYNLTRLKAINSHNHDLLEHSLDFIAMMESMITGDSAGVYSDNGSKIDEAAPAVLAICWIERCNRHALK